MDKFPTNLANRCRTLLVSECRNEFGSNESVKNIFWGTEIEEYSRYFHDQSSPYDRIDEVIRELRDRSYGGKSVLATFLEELAQRSYPEDDDTRIHLMQLAHDIQTWRQSNISSSYSTQPVLTSREIDVGIVIALKEEFRELLGEFVPAYTTDYDKDLHAYYYHFQQEAGNNSKSYRCVATIVGSMGPTEAALATQKLIDKCKPSTLVVLGIAASLDDDVMLGDVVLADVVDMYLENAKTVPDADSKRFTFQLSGEPYRTSHDLRVVAENFEFVYPEIFLQWQERSETDLSKGVLPAAVKKLIKKRQLRPQAQIHIGHIASGSAVAGALAFKEWLKNNRDRKYLALEMESGGFMAAVHKQGIQRSLVLRAISDYGDENKKLLDNTSKGAFRKYATHNAMRWLWNFFEADIFRLTK